MERALLKTATDFKSIDMIRVNTHTLQKQEGIPHATDGHALYRFSFGGMF